MFPTERLTWGLEITTFIGADIPAKTGCTFRLQVLGVLREEKLELGKTLNTLRQNFFHRRKISLAHAHP